MNHAVIESLFDKSTNDRIERNMSEPITYDQLVRSLYLYRDACESPEDWLVLEQDAIVDADRLVSANEMAFDMALCVAEIAHEAGRSEAVIVPDKAMIAKAENEGYECGYEEAAKDPKAWYLQDKHGEPLHLGDQAKTSEGIVRVSEITVNVDPMANRIFGCNANSEWEYKPWKIEKVTSDTREKIIKELADWLESGCSYQTCNDLAEQFVSRVEALGAGHE